MTRRALLYPIALSPRSSTPLTLPVNLVLDSKARRALHFEQGIWQEALRDLAKCGLQVQVNKTTGEVARPSQREPIITGLQPGKLNLVVTDQIPMYWDHGRLLNGLTTPYRGYHLCMVAMNWAHGHQVPVLSVNTCLHEILHALLLDIFERRPPGWMGHVRELRVDACATRMWLLGDGSGLLDSARAYLERLSGSANTEHS